METRKVQLTGGSTFTVSLPKQWANSIDLETGDRLRLFPQADTSLLVRPVRDDTDLWEAEVEVGDMSELKVRRTVQALYVAGFNRMTLSAASGLGDRRRVVSATARRFIGLEIVEATETHVTLQSLLDPATVSVEQSMIQLDQVALSMHEDAIEALLTQDADLVEHVVERDNQVDRLFAMISRHFQRSLESPRETDDLDLDRSELYDYQTIARQLERVADHAEKVAEFAARFERPPPTEFAEAIETNAGRSREIVGRATSTVVGDSAIETAHSALDSRDELTADLEALERELHERDVAEGHLVALTIDSLMRTAEYGGNIAETALQAAARNQQL